MLKAAGILLIILSGAGLGFCKSSELTKRENALGNILKFVILLKGEIRYANTSLPDAFLEIAGKLPEQYNNFLKAAAAQMTEGRGKSFEKIFQDCAKEFLWEEKLTAGDREDFLSLGSRLGYLDLAMQMKQLELYEQEVSGTLEELHREMPVKKKMYQSLGISCGILLAIFVW